ncbi:hypothetical protein VE04_09502 [Pseudogymnoascus sp. 24MN13]|nr:hypothetical protein VE04_09502 [Pseudogymnoascus sp. 24MN13]
MQAVGGTKGVLVEPFAAIESSVAATLADFGTAEQKKKWLPYLPEKFPIAMSQPPTVNFRSGYHPGSDTPMQFLNESANCRMFYTPAMLTNVTSGLGDGRAARVGHWGRLVAGLCAGELFGWGTDWGDEVGGEEGLES